MQVLQELIGQHQRGEPLVLDHAPGRRPAQRAGERQPGSGHGCRDAVAAGQGYLTEIAA